MKKIILGQKQVLLFVFAGAMSALVEILMMKIFSQTIPICFDQETDFHGIKYPLSNVLSTSCAILFNYWLSVRFVFERGKHGKKREFFYFMILSGITTFLSLSIFQIFINFIFLNPIDFKIYTLSPIILSKVMAIGIVSILNYIVKKNIIFRR